MRCVWWLAVVFAPLSLASVPSDMAAFSPEQHRECPENEQYTTCSSSSCFETVCHVPPTVFCTRDCKAGCQCKRGFARRGEVCVPLSECAGTSAIIWKSGDEFGRMGVLKLQSEAGRCVTTANLRVGENLTMHDCDKTKDLQLDFRVDGVIRSAANPELCVAVSPAQGARTLVLAECADTDSQKFQLDRMLGTISLASQPSLCLGNRAPSAELSLFACTGNSRQQWQLADNGCIPAPAAPLTDYGVEDEYRGWYDTKGCGVCRDYCRWVGRVSGGDPAVSQLVNTSHWSCGLAGSGREFTLPMHFQTWNFTKCSAIISELELLRSAAELALLLEAEVEMPMMPRSVPRRPRVTPSPTHSGMAPKLDPMLSANSSDVDSFDNGTNYGNSTIQANTQIVATNSQPSNDSSVIGGAVAGASFAVLLVGCVLCFLRKRKHNKEAPPPAPVPVETEPLAPAVSASPLRLAADVPIAPRVIVLPPVDDPPPPYHLAMAMTDDDLNKTR